jgi:UDP-N-acetylglucosamine 4,6-dehydratase
MNTSPSSLPARGFLNETRTLISGGTGSLGKQLARMILHENPSATIAIYSRDEFKQSQMEQSFAPEYRERLRFFLGDVRDGERLKRAMRGVNYVIHAAALKQVPAGEYNPFEFVKTNVIGAENIINAAIDCNVEHVVALSTDKAANPINVYGATKLCSDRLFVSGNNYSASSATRFSVVRYGNVVGSRGSVIPLFLEKRKTGSLPITDPRMTRFWITLDQGAALVLKALREMRGGEIWVPRIPSMRLTDLARVIAPECRTPTVGIRPGEKLHEVMIPIDDGRSTLAFKDHFIIQPSFAWWEKNWHANDGGCPCPDDFYYGSDNNTEWLTDGELGGMIAQLDLPEAQEWSRERGVSAPDFVPTF